MGTNSQDSGAGTVVSHLGVAVEVETTASERLRLRVGRNSSIVVGDTVTFSGERAPATPRRTELLRRTRGGAVHVVAANLDVLGVVAAVDPPARAGLLDRAAVAARAAGIEPFVVLNKMDLPDADAVHRDLAARVGEDLPLLAVSAESGFGVAALLAFLAARGRGALVGPSGVGKSSLLNSLIPELDLKTRSLSSATGAGRHTTTVSTLHRLPGGGELVDTPGVREFGLVDVTPGELAAHFPGFARVQAPCRFRDCAHKDEPGCAIKDAVTQGLLPESRYIAYRTLLDELAGP